MCCLFYIDFFLEHSLNTLCSIPLGTFARRADFKDYKTLKKAARFRATRGRKQEGNELLKLAGLKSLPSFLLRSALFDSVDLLWGSDKLHQDYLGGPKKMQKFLIKDRAPLGSAVKTGAAFVHITFLLSLASMTRVDILLCLTCV